MRVLHASVLLASVVFAQPAARDVSAYDFKMRPLPRGQVTLQGKVGPLKVAVEIAATPPSRTRGLMWRQELAEGTGMLFIFPQEDVLSFWMRNTLIPLDMVFIDEGLEIVGVVENAEPKTLSPRTAGKLALYVLEVPGGWLRRHGVKPGTKVSLEGTSMLNVE